MAAATQPSPAEATSRARPTVGPEHHGLAMDFDEFTRADFQEGWLYELARGIVIVTRVPEIRHGMAVARINVLFVTYEMAHPSLINYRAGRGYCCIRLPVIKSSRRPDHAVYLYPGPKGPDPWSRWTPQIVIEVIGRGSEDRDYVEKREEYLRAGVSEYWILDPVRRRMLILLRLGDTWEEHPLGEGGIHRTELLPGLEVRVGELLGPPEPEDE